MMQRGKNLNNAKHLNKAYKERCKICGEPIEGIAVGLFSKDGSLCGIIHKKCMFKKR